MIKKPRRRAAPRPAADQIGAIVSRCSLTDDPTDFHGGGDKLGTPIGDPERMPSGAPNLADERVEAGVATPVPDDAELLALGREHEAAYERWRLAFPAYQEACEDFDRTYEAPPREEKISEAESWNRYLDAREKHGVRAFDKANEAALNVIAAVVEKIRSIKPTCLSGLAVKARLLVSECIHGPVSYREPVENYEDLDWDHHIVRELIDEIDRLAAEALERETKPSGVDPFLALVTEWSAIEIALNQVTDDVDDVKDDPRWGRQKAIEDVMLRGATPSTLAGALSGLTMARQEVQRRIPGFDPFNPTDEASPAVAQIQERAGFGDAFVVAMLDAVYTFLEREQPPLDPAEPRPAARVKEDAVCTALTTQADAWAKWDAFPAGTPDADPAFSKADELEIDCWERLLKVVPTTLPGLKAWVDYLNQPRFVTRIDEAGDVETVMATMAKAVAYLQPTGGALAFFDQGRSTPVQPDGDLMPAMQAYEAAEANNLANPPEDLDDGPYQAEADQAWRALKQLVVAEGINTVSLAEARLATKIALHRQEDQELALALAFAALAYVLGEEAVS